MSRSLETEVSVPKRFAVKSSEAGGGESAASKVYSKTRPELGTPPPVDVFQVSLRVDAPSPVVVPQRGPTNVVGVQVRRGPSA